MPQNNFNQSQVGPPMVFAAYRKDAVRPFVAVANGESSKKIYQGNGFSNRGGRKPFQRGGSRF
ncbi:hypothetical protein Hanom_Chr07g00641671 [Helianthus anomalus]